MQSPCPRYRIELHKHSVLTTHQDLAPALIETIKTAGLVLITDVSDAEDQRTNTLAVANPSFHGMPDGVDGFLKGNGVLRFNDSIDM